MRSNYEDLIPDGPLEGDAYQKMERCEKAIRTVRKAVLMRLFLTGLLVYIPIAAKLRGAALVLLLVAAINLSGLLPLMGEWKKQKTALDKLLDEA